MASSQPGMPPLSVTVRLVATVGLAAILSQFLRGSVSVLAPDLMREIGIPAESLGLLTGVFFFTHAAMQLPNGVFLDRYGPRIVYTVSLCLLCIGTVMFAFAESVTGLFVARFFMGLGASALVLGAMVLFSRWYPSDRFPQMIAIVISISNIGTLSATTPLAAAAEWIGWRESFLVVAAVNLLAILLAILFVRDAPGRDAARAAAKEARGESLGAALVTAVKLFAHPKIRLLLPISLVAYAAVMSVQALWGGPYLHDVHGLGLEERSYVLFGMAIVTLLAPIGWGWLGTRIGPRDTVFVGAGLTVAFTAAFALLPRVGLVPAAALVIGFGVTAGYGIMLPATARLFLPESLSARAMTVTNIATIGGVSLWHVITGYIIGAFPPADGLIPEEAFRAMFAVFAVFAFAAGIVYWRIGPLPAVPPEEDAALASALPRN